MTFKISEELIETIKQHEGYRKAVYMDTLGKPTIGYGFLIEALELEEDVCDTILNRKLEKLIDTIRFKFTWFDNMPDTAKGVIVNMSYQLGVNGFAKFSKTIQYFKNKEWNLGSKEMLRSKWYMQTPNRAKELSEIIKSIEEKLDVINE